MMYKVSVHAKRGFLLKLLLLQIGCLCAIGITAKTHVNNVPTFTASASDNIKVDTQFRLMFTITSTKELDDADLMGLSVSMPKGLTVLMGPTRAKVSQLQNIGGKIISSHQVTYTYILSASQAGTFTIPAASIIVKGEKLCSQPLALTVVPAKQSSSGCTPQPRLDAFITMTVSERSPRVNAPIVLECKLYTAALVDIEDMEQFISPDDFKVESIDSRNRPLRTEHLNGKEYYTWIFQELLLYPLRTGELHIGDLRMEVSMRQVDKTIDPFDAFFNSKNTVNAKKCISCPGITLHVHE